MDSEKPLALSKGRIGQGEDLFDASVGHGIASDGDTVPMDHQGVARPAVGPIVSIRVSQVEGEVKFADRIERGRRYVIKPLRGLAVALLRFRSQTSPAVGANRIGLEQSKTMSLANPKFESLFLLEYPDKNGRPIFQARPGQCLFEFGRNPGDGLPGAWTGGDRGSGIGNGAQGNRKAQKNGHRRRHSITRLLFQYSRLVRFALGTVSLR